GTAWAEHTTDSPRRTRRRASQPQPGYTRRTGRRRAPTPGACASRYAPSATRRRSVGHRWRAGASSGRPHRARRTRWPESWRRCRASDTNPRDPERIYLEPGPYSPEGRLWSEHNVWPLYTWPPEPEGESERATGVEYIRSDLHYAEIARLARELEEARERLE